MKAHTTFENIDFAYGSKQILFNTLIRLPASGTVGIYGRNGTGKSTLFNCMMGIHPCPAMRITHSGVTLTTAAYRKPNFINLLSQGVNTLDFLTVRQCINLYGIKADVVLKFPGAIKSANQEMYTFSSGQRRLVENLLLIYSKSAITLLDEPFTGLMPINQEYIVSAIKEQSAQKTIVLSDHKADLVFDNCDHHYLLREGMLRAIQSKADLKHYGYLP